MKWNIKPDSNNREYEYERYEMLRILVKNTAGKGLMHESFHPDNHGSKFSRAWFAWANSYFSQFANCERQWLDEQYLSEMVQRKMDEVTENGVIGSEENLEGLPKVIGNVMKCNMNNYRNQKSNKANAYYLNEDSLERLGSPKKH